MNALNSVTHDTLWVDGENWHRLVSFCQECGRELSGMGRSMAAARLNLRDAVAMERKGHRE